MTAFRVLGAVGSGIKRVGVRCDANGCNQATTLVGTGDTPVADALPEGWTQVRVGRGEYEHYCPCIAATIYDRIS